MYKKNQVNFVHVTVSVGIIEIDVQCTLKERGLAPRYQLQYL